MARHELTFENLPKLGNGVIAAAWDTHMGKAKEDCRDRPLEAKPRKVVLIAEVTPIVDETNTMIDADTQYYVESTVPKSRSRVYRMGLHQRSGKLYFQEDSPDNPDQLSLEFDSKGQEILDMGKAHDAAILDNIPSEPFKKGETKDAD